MIAFGRMAPRVAVVGGGASACALVHALGEDISSGVIQLSLFEMGRGVGGRSATRRSREMPELLLDHGVPAFSARTESFAELCERFVDAGHLGRLSKTDPSQSIGILRQDGTYEAEPSDDTPPRFTAAAGKGISTFCEGLIRGGGDNSSSPIVSTVFSTMVKELVPLDEGGWRLAGKDGTDLGEFDWLVVAGNVLGHPRWSSAFGGSPPLVAAAGQMDDAPLHDALAALSKLQHNPVTACLLAFEGDAAKVWASLPFFKCAFEEDPVLARLVVRRVSPTLTTAVVHSTHAFSLGVSDVYGSTSTAARLGGAGTNAEREAVILEEMLAALEARLVPKWLSDATMLKPAWGPHLHRWGSAFPAAPMLPERHAWVPSARVAFCGDYVEGGRAGTVEGAVTSGLRTGHLLREELLQ